MPTLTQQEISTVSAAAEFSGGTSSASTICRVYQAVGSSWNKIALGAACVVTQAPSAWIRVVDLNEASVVFEQQMYEGFDYQAPKAFFHTFEGDDAVIGLSFADEGEAQQFLNKVNSSKPSGQGAVPPSTPSRPPPTSSASTSQLMSPTSDASAMTSPPPNKKGTIKKKSFFSKIFSKDPSDDFMPISEPRNFAHVSSIGWSADKGFEIRNIPPDWKKLFQQAGIKKGELKNAETAQFVMNIIQENGGVDKVNEELKGAPPAPPVPDAPPPPPAPAPPPMAPLAPPPPSNLNAPAPDNGRGGLLSQIQTGTSLRHVDAPVEPGPPKSQGGGGMANLLAQAMDSRRMAIGGGGGEEDDSDWSDEDWN